MAKPSNIGILGKNKGNEKIYSVIVNGNKFPKERFRGISFFKKCRYLRNGNYNKKI